MTTIASASGLSVVISAAVLRGMQAGPHTVTVFNPSPGGGTSNGLTLTLQ
jgi:hypothetical protein